MGSGAIDPFLTYPMELGRVERELVANSKFIRNWCERDVAPAVNEPDCGIDHT